MSTKLVSSIVLTEEICPNCRSEMTVTEVSPIFFADHLEKVTYRCKACHSEMKRTYDRYSGAWQVPHPDPDHQYRVTFFKYLLSSNGRPFKCLQHTVEIRRAKNAERALKAAEYRYERFRHVQDWKLYADTFELEVCSPLEGVRTSLP
jgi:transposase-like protein